MSLLSRQNRIYPRLALGSAVLAAALGAAAVLPAAMAAEAPPPGQLASQVSLLRTLDRLHLTQAQLREVVQRLDQYFHAQNQLDQHEEDAAKPVAPQLRRIKTALEAGDAPDSTDQQQVDAAFAGLKPERTQVARLRRETINGIRQILNRTQIALLRTATGATDTAADGGQRPQMIFQFAPRAKGGGNGGFTIVTPVAPGAQGDGFREVLPDAGVQILTGPADALPTPNTPPDAANPAAGTRDIGKPGTAAPVAPIPLPAAPAPDAPLPDAPQTDALPGPAAAPVPVAYAETVLSDAPPELPAAAPPTATAAPTATAEAPAIDNDLVAARPETMEQRMARLERQLDRIENRLDALQKQDRVERAQQMAAQELKEAQRQQYLTGALAAPQAAMGGMPGAIGFGGQAYGGAWAGGSTLDDDAIARIFLQPESLRFLRTRAAKG